MSVSYKAVGWNAFKKRYDLVLIVAIVAFLAVFVGAGMAFFPKITFEILLIRAFAAAGITLLHFILVIGPMARLDRRWLPLLYNRRHLGVAMFLLGLFHAAVAVVTYHAGGTVNPIVSIFTLDAGTTMSSFPFQAFGFVALLILFVMAATSHDFWLANLTAPVWKTLHMLVYVAYVCLVVHVAFGILQAETSPFYAAVMGAGLLAVAGLHLLAGWKQAGIDAELTVSPGEDPSAELGAGGFLPVCAVDDLVENEPLGVTVGGERVAVLRYEGNRISAVSGVCQHQNGPLAEGKFVLGCLTCPWHGYQYKPEDGTSPEPFTEKIPTFAVKVADGRVWIDPTPHPAGTRVEPALVN
ncbi:MAG: Rieske 2Fe-2S domain-containing protein [Akkermansiaceae bacterium]|nr:Rieske 2Fe-2S domain-containing protein [Akkermansiaceae bacterium]NNM31260.1 Rieske 2Fe-2S domain-containing protein [Akkermansiaceae bacterium]